MAPSDSDVVVTEADNTLMFTSTERGPLSITVTASDDNVAKGNDRVVAITNALSCTGEEDCGYEGIKAEDVRVTVDRQRLRQR